jgi:hypothetical protein
MQMTVVDCTGMGHACCSHHNHLTQNIASIPFYGSCRCDLPDYLHPVFDPRWYLRPALQVVVMLPTMAWFSGSLDLWRAAPIFTLGLFVCCMFCHGELYGLKPGPRYLTNFYLMISVGGALGALLVGIAAPNFLPGYFEIEITLVACAVLLLARTMRVQWWLTAGSIAVLVATVVRHSERQHISQRNPRHGAQFLRRVRTRDFRSGAFRAMYHAYQTAGSCSDPGLRTHPALWLTSGMRCL